MIERQQEVEMGVPEHGEEQAADAAEDAATSNNVKEHPSRDRKRNGGATEEQREVEMGVPEHGEEQATDTAEDAATSNDVEEYPKKRRRRCIIIIAVIVMVVVLIVITLAAVLTTDDNEATGVAPNPEYSNILTQMNINVSSSDTEVEHAMLNLTDYFLKTSTCSAGISVGVIRNGTRITVSRGVLDMKEPNRTVDQDTLFEIGSVSKPVTGLVLAHEIVSGNHKNLTLDSPINSLLPDSVPNLVVKGELVTFRQLVTHTAGFPRLPKVIRESNYQSFSDPNPYAGYSEEDMLRELSIAASELSQTGEYEYSNFGFSTLAYLLQRSRNNVPFPVLQRELLSSLGLENTWIELPKEARQNLSSGYEGQQQVPYWFDGGIFIDGAGSTLSSTRDLLTLVELLMSPEETKQQNYTADFLIEALQLSLSPLYAFDNNRGVAFAWNQFHQLYSHIGSTAGFVTYVSFQPATRTGVVTLSNCGGDSDSATLGDALALKLFVLPQSAS